MFSSKHTDENDPDIDVFEEDNNENDINQVDSEDVIKDRLQQASELEQPESLENIVNSIAQSSKNLVSNFNNLRSDGILMDIYNITLSYLGKDELTEEETEEFVNILAQKKEDFSSDKYFSVESALSNAVRAMKTGDNGDNKILEMFVPQWAYDYAEYEFVKRLYDIAGIVFNKEAIENFMEKAKKIDKYGYKNLKHFETETQQDEENQDKSKRILMNNRDRIEYFIKSLRGYGKALQDLDEKTGEKQFTDKKVIEDCIDPDLMGNIHRYGLFSTLIEQTGAYLSQSTILNFADKALENLSVKDPYNEKSFVSNVIELNDDLQRCGIDMDFAKESYKKFVEQGNEKLRNGLITEALSSYLAAIQTNELLDSGEATLADRVSRLHEVVCRVCKADDEYFDAAIVYMFNKDLADVIKNADSRKKKALVKEWVAREISTNPEFVTSYQRLVNNQNAIIAEVNSAFSCADAKDYYRFKTLDEYNKDYAKSLFRAMMNRCIVLKPVQKNIEQQEEERPKKLSLRNLTSLLKGETRNADDENLVHQYKPAPLRGGIIASFLMTEDFTENELKDPVLMLCKLTEKYAISPLFFSSNAYSDDEVKSLIAKSFEIGHGLNKKAYVGDVLGVAPTGSTANYGFDKRFISG
ncbi:hypothetical protein DRJ17_01035 [Candidatus Woesearchaeota archaeon]|nr:MAG: hypothetical protein DRJ17_01035 [Candidatus Woesearchaeota archaeon]